MYIQRAAQHNVTQRYRSTAELLTAAGNTMIIQYWSKTDSQAFGLSKILKATDD